jgi:hypothetical protein
MASPEEEALCTHWKKRWYRCKSPNWLGGNTLSYCVQNSFNKFRNLQIQAFKTTPPSPSQDRSGIKSVLFKIH